MRDGVLAAIGETPLVRLERAALDVGFDLFAKLECLNPGGSIKDRPAREILENALRSGTIGPDTVIIESSSGNMGIGLAQACRLYGLRFICVVDPKATIQNVKIMRAYGAEIDYVLEPDPATGEFLQARILRVQELLGTIKSSFWPNQYANSHNSGSHYRTTMHEIATDLAGKVDFLFVATSTCGTIRGCGEYVRDHDLKTHIVAVDAVGSLIFGSEKAERKIPGLGAGLRPPLCDLSLVHQVVHVTDLDCVIGCRRLIEQEALLCGGSSGAVLAAFDRLKGDIPAGSNCVIILPDRGDRYLDTIFSEEWVLQHFGAVEHLWKKNPKLGACLAATV